MMKATSGCDCFFFFKKNANRESKPRQMLQRLGSETWGEKQFLKLKGRKRPAVKRVMFTKREWKDTKVQVQTESGMWTTLPMQLCWPNGLKMFWCNFNMNTCPRGSAVVSTSKSTALSPKFSLTYSCLYLVCCAFLSFVSYKKIFCSGYGY